VNWTSVIGVCLRFGYLLDTLHVVFDVDLADGGKPVDLKAFQRI